MEEENNENILNKDENINNGEKENNIENIQNNENVIKINQENVNQNEININENNNINEIKENININNNEKKEEDNHIENNNQKENEKDANDNSTKNKNNPLYVFSAKILDINSVKVAIYFLKGTLVPKKIARSFKDIELFRDFLRNIWPCIYIPNFALREEKIEENSKIVPEEKKMSLLNHFFKQIAESKYLLESEVTQIFTVQTGDFSTEITKLKKEDMKTISEKYLKTFTDFVYNRKEIDEKEKFIKNFVGILSETYKQFIIIGATVLKEMFNYKREQNTIKFLADMFIDMELQMPNKKKRLGKIKDVVAPIMSVSNIIYIFNYLLFLQNDEFKPYIDFYVFYLKYKEDISSYLEAFSSLQEYKTKREKIQEKLKNLSLKGNTNYSFLVAERENRITTTSGDLAYNYEIEAFNLKQIIDVSIHVLEKQMKFFQKNLYKKYHTDIIKFRKGMIEKNTKNIDIWKQIEDLIHVK